MGTPPCRLYHTNPPLPLGLSTRIAYPTFIVQKNTPLNIVWFKRDLRVSDHHPLAAAAATGPTLPLYVFEPDVWRSPDMSARHRWWVTISVHELRQRLSELGQPLVVRSGDIISVLEDLRSRFGHFVLWSHEETGNGQTYQRDREVLAWCRSHGITWNEWRQFGVIRRLRSRDAWSTRCESFMASPIEPAPTALQPIATTRALSHTPLPILPLRRCINSLVSAPARSACAHSCIPAARGTLAGSQVQAARRFTAHD